MVASLVFQWGGGAFQNILNNMQSMGLFLYLFPFLLALAIFYGALEFGLKDKISKQVRGVVSIILAFFVMLYSSWNVQIVGFFANLGGGVLLVATAILMLVILFGLMGLKFDDLFGDKGSKHFKWISVAVIILIVFLIAVGSGAGNLIGMPYWSTNSDFVTMLAVGFVVLIAIWWLTQGGEKKEAAPKAG